MLRGDEPFPRAMGRRSALPRELLARAWAANESRRGAGTPVGERGEGDATGHDERNGRRPEWVGAPRAATGTS
jgi:hypothetical protein